MLRLARWSRDHTLPDRPGQRFSSAVVYCDLKTTSAEAAPGGPLNLVPPLDFESKPLSEADRLWEDTTARCKLKAEMRAAGRPVPATRMDVLRLLEEDRLEAEQKRETLAALQRTHQTAPAKDRALVPAQFGHEQRKRLRRHAGYLAQFMNQTVLFTVTFTTTELEALSGVANGAGRMASTLNRAISQKLKRRGGHDQWMCVWELQPKRTAETGMPALHLHYVIRNKQAGGYTRPWLISKAEFTAMAHAALRTVTGYECPDGGGRTHVVAVKHDIYGYLSKYFSKGSETALVDWSQWPGLVPKQWVYVSGGLRKMAKAHEVRVSGDFIDWVVVNGDLLKQARLCHSRVFAPDDMPVGNVASIQFYGVRQLGVCLALFERDVRRQLNSHLGKSYGYLTKNEFDPVSSVGLPIPAVQLEAYRLATIPVRDTGRVPDEFREVLERTFRQVDIPEPIFIGARSLRVETAAQLQLFDRLFGAAEIHESPGAD